MALECFRILHKLSPPCLNDLVVLKNNKDSSRYSNIVEIPMLYSDMTWSRSSDIYIGVIYLHVVFVFYFISPETVPFRCHFVLYMIYLSLCMYNLL